MLQDLLTIGEVGALLGVSRQGVNELARTYEDFPAPVGRVGRWRLWDRGQVEQWAKRWGRKPERGDLDR